MRRLYFSQGLVGSIICAWLSAGSLDAKPAAPSEDILVPAGAEVMIVTKTDIHSNTVVVGERLTLEVLRDVIVNGRVVIAKGAAVETVVTLAIPRRSFGRGGKLDISVENVTAVDGQKIKLRAALNKKGEGGTGKAVIGAILLGPFGGREQKGVNARIKAGTEIKAQTTEEKAVSVGPAQPQTQDREKIQKPGS
jgi:hypothetical protein